MIEAELHPTSKNALFTTLPPEWPDTGLRAATRRALQATRRCVVAIDDDPTGNQTVHDVWVLTHWQVDDLQRALADGDPALYILTNSRSLPQEKAIALNREVAANLAAAARAAGRPITLVSRSDSTLRGHFPAEVDALRETWESASGQSFAGICLIPFFPEGGRFTINDIHWVAEGDMLVPVAQTPYAQDKAFGFHHSYLPLWVNEKTGGRAKAEDVLCISLETVRQGGPEAVATQLRTATNGRIVIVNAASYRDLDVFVAGLRQVEAEGKHFLFRTAASFVKAAAGLPDRPLLTGEELTLGRPAGGGLIVFGSHVPKSTAQLKALLQLPRLTAIELHVQRVLHQATRNEEIERAAAKANNALRMGHDALLFTSRHVVVGENQAAALEIAQAVSAALMAVVSRIEQEPRFVIGKGGITSSDLATVGMHVRAARVAGQILPGVPVWRPGPGSRWPDIPYIIFPGNVGSDDAVAQITLALRGDKQS